MRDTDTEATSTVFVVERMKSGRATRGTEVARFESAIVAARDAARRDEGREYSDPWHRVVAKTEASQKAATTFEPGDRLSYHKYVQPTELRKES